MSINRTPCIHQSDKIFLWSCIAIDEYEWTSKTELESTAMKQDRFIVHGHIWYMVLYVKSRCNSLICRQRVSVSRPPTPNRTLSLSMLVHISNYRASQSSFIYKGGQLHICDHLTASITCSHEKTTRTFIDQISFQDISSNMSYRSLSDFWLWTLPTYTSL